MKISGLNTPALVLDINILKANAEAMKSILENTSLKLRPHYKSHKCASIAKWQIKNGAIGMTCAKLSEAEDLCDVGIEDILIANQIVEPAKIRRLADLANNCRLTVCVDSIENVNALSAAAKNCGSTIHCFVEYDIGMQRCGVVENEEVLALAKHILSSDNLEFDGIQAYAGHISHVEDIADRKKMTVENYDKLKKLLSYLEENGIDVKTVSGGSTGTAEIKALEGLYTELQAGSYLFMDATYRNLSLPFKNSLFILTTVVSQRDGLTVVDAGVKTCGVDQGMPAPYVGSTDEIVASEEHFQLHGYTEKTSVGEKMYLVPAHCCSTVNLHDKIYLVDGDTVVDRIPITAKGIGR
ncbi:MAG: DSD1 family PLP-dependent enzyme [Clostridia bacterium]|nr:DSD1 family PLP-dependent enzyme [Clostridia bacterium]